MDTVKDNFQQQSLRCTYALQVQSERPVSISCYVFRGFLILEIYMLRDILVEHSHLYR